MPRRKQTTTYQQWQNQVDDLIFEGCPDDLPLPYIPNQTYTDWYLQGKTPRQASKRAIKQAY